MITNLFITFLNMSISAFFIAILLILWRSITKKYIPYKFFYLLWGALFLRLALPMSIQSAFSALSLIFNMAKSSVGGSYMVTMEYVDIANAEALTQSTSSSFLDILAIIWLIVSIGLVIMWLILYSLAKRQLSYSVLVKDSVIEKVTTNIGIKKGCKVFASNKILSPVIIGFIKPRIIVPQDAIFSETEKECILSHEMIHIKRHDQFIKAAMFFITAFHWYNPIVWLSFYLFNEDIETSCDQDVLAKLGFTHKKEYATALVSCADQNNSFKMGYLSFAQSKVFSRVNNVLNSKPISLLKKVIFTIITLLIGFSVSANPVLAQNYTYIPKSVYVNSNIRNNIKAFTYEFIEDMRQGSSYNLLTKSTADAEYFAQMYKVFEQNKIDASIDKIFYTSNESAVIYLRLLSPSSFLAKDNELIVLEVGTKKIMNGLYADSLHTYLQYELIHKVDYENEAVMLCQKMIKYGLLSGENSLANAEKITAFCMDIAYDRQKSKASTTLKSSVVEKIATEFFEITDFDNMRNTPYYDPQTQTYSHNLSTGQYFEYQITNLELTPMGAVVTAEFYKDPLQTQKEKIIKYTFKKVS